MTGYQSKRSATLDLTDGILYDEVMEQMAEDMRNSDFTAIEELLRFVPRENLIAFLKEDV
jgi:dihydroneopterin aldolase